MPLITVVNVSPLIPIDLRYVRTDKPTDEDVVYAKRMQREGPVVPAPFGWRDSLKNILVEVTCRHFNLTPDDVSCFFPHDPSVPIYPSPTAFLKVELLYRKPERTPELILEYRNALGKACSDFLKKLRGTDKARVEVKVELCDPEDVEMVE
ncbi:MAG: hypothetical protein PHS79_01990 [Patescibacteria group bacterium]|nr:hypothetical protein [Patescibacteria group bacterium]